MRSLAAVLMISTLVGSAVAQPASKKKKPVPPKTEAVAAPKGPEKAPADSSPMAELKKSNAQLKKVLGQRGPSWSPEREAKNSEVRKIVGGFLDFEELARRALGKNWEPLTPKQRTEFVATLRELVERNYLKQMHGQPEYDLQFLNEEKKDEEATVNAKLLATAKAKKITMEIIYKMTFHGGHWVVYDVITDEQSLLENYRAEFSKIINKDGFDALMKRMKKKLGDSAQ